MWRNVGFLLKLAKIGFFYLNIIIIHIYIEGVILHFFLLCTDWFLDVWFHHQIVYSNIEHPSIINKIIGG